MSQPELFEIPNLREIAKQQRAERQAAEQTAKDSRRFDREAKAKERNPAGEATCCFYFFSRRSGWQRCPDCQKPLTYK